MSKEAPYKKREGVRAPSSFTGTQLRLNYVCYHVPLGTADFKLTLCNANFQILKRNNSEQVENNGKRKFSLLRDKEKVSK